MYFLRQCIITYSKTLFKRPLLYLSIFVLQIVSLCSVFFAVGLIFNAATNFQNAAMDERLISIISAESFDESGEVLPAKEIYEASLPYAEVSDGINELKKLLKDNMLQTIMIGYIPLDDENCTSVVTGDINNPIDPYSLEEFTSYDIGELKGVVKIHSSLDIPNEWKTQTEALNIGGNLYGKVNITDAEMIAYIDFPVFEYAPENIRYQELHIYLKQPMLYSESENVKAVIDRYFHPVRKGMPKVPELLETQMNNTQIAVSAAMIVICALNTALCYHFIYNSRRKLLSIYRICGATEAACLFIYLIEVMLHSLVGFGVAYLLFDGLLKNTISEVYENAALAYNDGNYMTVFVCYIMITIVIMIVNIRLFVKKTIVEERK